MLKERKSTKLGEVQQLNQSQRVEIDRNNKRQDENKKECCIIGICKNCESAACICG